MAISSPRVLVTGGGGFIGHHLVRLLAERGIPYRLAVRRSEECGTDRFLVGEIGPATDWGPALSGIDVIVHLAGRAHVLNEKAANPHAEFMRVNVQGTAALAAAALAAGVQRLIYVSSIGVLGNSSGAAPFTATTHPRPHNAYTKSKLAGECAARNIGGGKLEVVVVRPPLVYGSGVPANFLQLMRWVDRELPLPLGAVHNLRSLVSVWNLCDLITVMLTHPAAPGRNWLVSDGKDISTPDLIRELAHAMGRRPRLISVPVGLLGIAGKLTGKSAQLTQLCGSLTVDISETRKDLTWSPILTFDEGIARTVTSYVHRELGAY